MNDDIEVVEEKEELCKSLCPDCKSVEFTHTPFANEITICPICHVFLEFINGILTIYNINNHNGFIPDADDLLQKLLELEG